MGDVSRILVGHVVFSMADDMEIEHTTMDFSPTLVHLAFRAFDSDPFDVLVGENDDDCLSMLVELLDYLCFEVFDPRPGIR